MIIFTLNTYPAYRRMVYTIFLVSLLTQSQTRSKHKRCNPLHHAPLQAQPAWLNHLFALGLSCRAQMRFQRGRSKHCRDLILPSWRAWDLSVRVLTPGTLLCLQFIVNDVNNVKVSQAPDILADLRERPEPQTTESLF
jgi:hypothetical protein